jgi:hypothetical protein
MNWQAKFAAVSLSLCWTIHGVGVAANGLDGGLVYQPERVARTWADDLDPRLLGETVFAWDGSLEQAVGWQLGVTVGEYVQAFEIDGTLISVIVCGLGNAPSITAPVSAVVYDDDGPGGTPGTLLAMSEASTIPGPFNDSDCTELTVPATVRSGRTFLGASWMPSQNPGFFIATDNSDATPLQDAYGRGTMNGTVGPWRPVTDLSRNVRALGVGARLVSMAQATEPCVEDANVLCLNDGRFRVESRFRRPDDMEGQGTDANLRTDDAAVFWFFDPSNLELLIKVLDACGVNGHYWVFASATTNVEVHLTVTDTQSGQVKTYFNPLGKAALPVQDTSAFATCP